MVPSKVTVLAAVEGDGHGLHLGLVVQGVIHQGEGGEGAGGKLQILLAIDGLDGHVILYLDGVVIYETFKLQLHIVVAVQAGEVDHLEVAIGVCVFGQLPVDVQSLVGGYIGVAVVGIHQIQVLVVHLRIGIGQTLVRQIVIQHVIGQQVVGKQGNMAVGNRYITAVDIVAGVSVRNSDDIGIHIADSAGICNHICGHRGGGGILATDGELAFLQNQAGHHSLLIVVIYVDPLIAVLDLDDNVLYRTTVQGHGIVLIERIVRDLEIIIRDDIAVAVLDYQLGGSTVVLSQAVNIPLSN